MSGPVGSARSGDLLNRYPLAIQSLVSRLAGLLDTTVDDLEERVNLGWRSISYIDAEGGYVVGVFPFQEHVHLLFEHGHRLEDPSGVLMGHENRQVRYLELRPDEEVDEATIRNLVLAAVHEARLRRAVTATNRRARRR